MLIKTKWLLEEDRLQKISEILELTSRQKAVKFVIKQDAEDESQMCFYCVPTSNLENTLDMLEEKGYTEGPKPSENVLLREGDKIVLKIQGNIKEEDDRELQVTYMSHRMPFCQFKVHEVDQYGNKSFNFYRGKAKIFMERKYLRKKSMFQYNSRPMMYDTIQSKKEYTVEEKEQIFLAELDIELPKVRKYHLRVESIYRIEFRHLFVLESAI